MCSPPSVGSTFSKNSFCNYRVQEAVSIPKLASKPPLMGGHFRLVLCKLYYVLPSERKMAHFRSSVWHHFCSRMHFKANFIFSVLTLPLASFADRYFSLRLHGSRPSFNGMLKFADHKRSLSYWFNPHRNQELPTPD